MYEPYQSAGGTVTQNTWKNWNTKAGKWWGTKATVPRAGGNVSNPCVQATPCTWTQLLTTFPNLGIHNVYGAVVLKAGSGWSNFRGNVDSLAIGIDSVTTIYNFEEHATPASFALHTEFDGVAGTALPGDTTYSAGVVINYNFSAASGRQGLVVVVDDTIAAASGSIVMNSPHEIYAAADPILVPTAEVQDLSSRLMAVLNASDKPSAYSDFLQWYLDRSDAIGSDQLGEQLRVASYLTIDPVDDRDLLVGFYSAMAGHLDIIDNYGGSRSTYYYSPEDFGEGGAARRSPRPGRLTPRAGSHFARLSPRARSLMVGPVSAISAATKSGTHATASIVTGAPWPQEPMMINYVNGINTSAMDAARTAELVTGLVYEMERYAGPNTSAEVSHFWNRDAAGQMAAYSPPNVCIAKYTHQTGINTLLTSAVRYAQCKGVQFNRRLVNNDIFESVQQFIQLRYNRGIHIEDARQVATQDSVFHAWGYHVIHLAHSQGNMVVAQALQELPTREGKPLQRGFCAAQLTMASPIPRANIPLDAYYVKGFTVPNDILLQLLLPNDFPRYPTDTSRKLDTLLAKAHSDDERVKLSLKYGPLIHSVDQSYFTYPANRAHVKAMVDSLSDECTVGSIVTTPSEVTVPYNGHVKVGVSVRNRNDRVLLGRQFAGGGAHWGIGLDSMVYGMSPTTSGPETGSLTAFGQNFGQMTVTVGPAHFLGTIVEHHETAWTFSDGYSEDFTPVPYPTGSPGWDGSPGGCTASITMSGGPNWMRWVAACTRYFTLEVPAGSMPGGTRLHLLLADYPSGDLHSGAAPSQVPPEGITGYELGNYRCGPNYCLRKAVIQTVTLAGDVITSDTLCFSDNCGGSNRRAKIILKQPGKLIQSPASGMAIMKPLPVLKRPPE